MGRWRPLLGVLIWLSPVILAAIICALVFGL